LRELLLSGLACGDGPAPKITHFIQTAKGAPKFRRTAPTSAEKRSAERVEGGEAANLGQKRFPKWFFR
jgi:hypothetical protein